jgi:hypothetical protein
MTHAKTTDTACLNLKGIDVLGAEGAALKLSTAQHTRETPASVPAHIPC